MPYRVYKERGIHIRNHCRTEPPRDLESSGLLATVGGRDRASASYATADCVEAPARAARRRFRGIHGGRTAPPLPAETRAVSGPATWMLSNAILIEWTRTAWITPYQRKRRQRRRRRGPNRERDKGERNE